MPPKKPKSTDCDLCSKRIVEGKEDALQCEGGCGLWFHHYCAGVSISHFKELSNSSEPFVCYACYQRSQLAIMKQLRSEVAHLKGKINKLAEQLAKLSTASLQDEVTVSQLSTSNIYKSGTNSNVPTYAAASKQAGNLSNPSTSNMHAQPSFNRAPGANAKRNSPVDKRFNMVIYGLTECPKGSPRHEHISYNTNLACKTIKSICPDLSDYAVCDCLRIGKYSKQRTRPLTVKFAHSYDVTSILSNRHKISKADCPNVFLKPFMSTAERKTESTLLKKRRTLIDSGVERKLIKIRGNSLYINKAKVGSANEDIFIQHQQSRDQSQDPILLTRHGTNNAMPTNVASSAASIAMSTNDTNDVITTNEEPKHKM